MTLTPKHFTAFGLSINAYASAEFSIKAAISGLLGVSFAEGLIVTEPYSAVTIKNVATSLVKLSKLPKAQRAAFVQHVGDWAAFSALRNQIAHNRWENGKRPGSVHAVGYDIRSGTPKWIVNDKSRDWMVDELIAEAQKLADVNTRLIEFLQTTGFLESIAKNTPVIKSLTDD